MCGQCRRSPHFLNWNAIQYIFHNEDKRANPFGWKRSDKMESKEGEWDRKRKAEKNIRKKEIRNWGVRERETASSAASKSVFRSIPAYTVVFLTMGAETFNLAGSLSLSLFCDRRRRKWVNGEKCGHILSLAFSFSLSPQPPITISLENKPSCPSSSIPSRAPVHRTQTVNLISSQLISQWLWTERERRRWEEERKEI